MVTNKKVFGRAGSMPKGLALGTTAALVLTVGYAILMTQLILTETVDMTALGYGSMILLPVVSAVSAWIAVSIIKRKRMQVCLLSGGVYFTVLALINIFFFGGQFQGVLVTVALILAGVLVVGVMGLRGERGSGKKYRSFRSR